METESKTGKPRSEARKRYQHEWYMKNRAKLIARAKTWRIENREKANEYSRRFKLLKPEKRHQIQMKSRLKRRYNIDPDLYFQMFQSQDGLCAICKQPELNSTGRTKLLAVDHNHTTGEIRALLCKGCNLGLGNMKESPERLIAAANYLKEWNEKG